jgi:hypothetical protein
VNPLSTPPRAGGNLGITDQPSPPAADTAPPHELIGFLDPYSRSAVHAATRRFRRRPPVSAALGARSQAQQYIGPSPMVRGATASLGHARGLGGAAGDRPTRDATA